MEGEAEQEGPRRLDGLWLAAGTWQRGGGSPAELWGTVAPGLAQPPHPGQPTMGVRSLAPALAPLVTSLGQLLGLRSGLNLTVHLASCLPSSFLPLRRAGR